MIAIAKCGLTHVVATVILLTLLAGCSAGGPSASVPPQDTPGGGINLLVGGQGKLYLKREYWPAYVPVSTGSQVKRGDLVRLETGQTAAIVCADLSLHTIRGEQGVPCQVDAPVLQRDGIRLIAPRAPSDDIPYILYPRNTIILEPRPTLKWYDIGAASYTVAILQDGQPFWEQTGVRDTMLRYPDTAPALKPGIDYLLSVTSEGNPRASSADDPAKGLRFRVVSAAERATIEARWAAIQALPLDDDSRHMVLAIYYSGMELRGEALALLDSISNRLPVPSIQLQRGDLLLAMRLPEAERAYQAALQQGMTFGDLESQAAAHAGLWRAKGDPDELNTAISLYEQLGDKDQAQLLRAEGNSS